MQKSHGLLKRCHFNISCKKLMKIQNVTAVYVFGNLARELNLVVSQIKILEQDNTM